MPRERCASMKGSAEDEKVRLFEARGDGVVVAEAVRALAAISPVPIGNGEYNAIL